MASNWIIVGAIIVLVAGVVLAFRSAAQDAPKTPRGEIRRTKPVTKGTAAGN